MKRILLTGASAGIGRQIAESLANNGHKVWGTSRNSERLLKLNNFHPLNLDLNDSGSIEACARDALEASGGIDVLINNAGSGLFGSVEHTTGEKMVTQFQIHVFGPLELISKLLPAMRESESGLIINVTSLAAEFPVPFMAAYSAAKAAMSTFTWGLETELHNSGIRIIELRPGDIRTEFGEHLERNAIEDESYYRERSERAFKVHNRKLRTAPAPSCVADVVLEIVNAPNSAPSQRNTGSIFQSRLAPVFKRLLPGALIRFGLRRYFNVD